MEKDKFENLLSYSDKLFKVAQKKILNYSIVDATKIINDIEDIINKFYNLDGDDILLRSQFNKLNDHFGSSLRKIKDLCEKEVILNAELNEKLDELINKLSQA